MVDENYNYNTNKSSIGKKIFEVFLILVLIGLLGYLIYTLYDTLPGKPEPVKAIVSNVSEDNFSLSDVKQFYPNMKFNHNSISYKIDPFCNNKQKQRMLDAFNEVSNIIGLINFSESEINPDIEILCSESEKATSQKEYFIAGEGGAREIVQTGKYNVIVNGVILLYGVTKNAKVCSWSNVEIHELMHVFGFNHSESKDSIMYPYLESCNQRLDNSIVNELERLYSEKNLPDLYFEDVNVIKKGRYLDFNITVKNSGTKDADNVNYTILEDNQFVETNKLGNIKFGAGIFMEIKNLKLLYRNPKEIVFVIDKENSIEELDKQNNIVKINFD